MITKEERESIIAEATERMLLKIPEVVGNLITNYAEKIRVKKEFYDKYPEFKDHKEVVASTIEDTENTNPSMSFKEIVNTSVPNIRRRIESLKGLDTKSVSKPNLDFNSGHGEL